MITVCERHVTLFPAWFASTKAFICTACPLGSGALGGIASFAYDKIASSHILEN